MRWSGWIAAALIVLLPCLASAFEHGTRVHPYAMGNPYMAALSGPACSTPPGLAQVPGCCYSAPKCCANVWAGYCQEKAHARAFWTRACAPIETAPMVNRCAPAEGAPCAAPASPPLVPDAYGPTPAPRAQPFPQPAPFPAPTPRAPADNPPLPPPPIVPPPLPTLP